MYSSKFGRDVLKGGYRVHVWQSSQGVEYLHSASEDSPMNLVLKDILRNSENRFISSISQGLEVLKDEKNLFLGGKFTFYGHEDQIQILDNFEESVNSYCAFGLQKDSEFLKIFNYHLAAMFQVRTDERKTPKQM